MSPLEYTDEDLLQLNDEDNDDNEQLFSILPIEFVLMSSSKLTDHNDLEINKTCLWRFSKCSGE